MGNTWRSTIYKRCSYWHFPFRVEFQLLRLITGGYGLPYDSSQATELDRRNWEVAHGPWSFSLKTCQENDGDSNGLACSPSSRCSRINIVVDQLVFTAFFFRTKRGGLPKKVNTWLPGLFSNRSCSLLSCLYLGKHQRFQVVLWPINFPRVFEIGDFVA